MVSLPRWVRELRWRFVIHELIFREAAIYVASSTRCSGKCIDFLDYLRRAKRHCYLDRSDDRNSVLEGRYYAVLDSLSKEQKVIRDLFASMVREGIFISLPARSLTVSEQATTRRLRISNEEYVYIKLTLTNNDNILVCVSCMYCPFNLNQEKKRLNLNCRELCRC